MKTSAIRTGLALLLGVVVSAPAVAAPIPAVLYKNPQCSCCEGYAQYLDQNGFAVKVIPTDQLDLVTRMAGVPTSLEGCHTMRLGDYVIEGHVPAPLIRKLLAEHLPITGIGIPGMPAGVPGMPAMPGMKTAPITVYEIGTATPVVFGTVN
ncbi:MAG: metal-binding protein [Acidocella sp. 20-61-6]|nr:MAG: metal-binding protein [Acidocella sp. 20-61-6]